MFLSIKIRKAMFNQCEQNENKNTEEKKENTKQVN